MASDKLVVIERIWEVLNAECKGRNTVFFKDVTDAIKHCNELDGKDRSAKNPANFMKDLIRSDNASKNWPTSLASARIGDELIVFDYIYGVLHSPDYRRTYAQFLKIDFPRIPYPASPEVFARVADKGGQLRRLHLMEDAAIGATPYPFKGDGDNVVVKPGLSDDGRVMINPDQYFEAVPQTAWEFHIGGYQPAKKWLKDRKGRALSFDDVIHYQKIIKILTETDRIMKDIELPIT